MGLLGILYSDSELLTWKFAKYLKFHTIEKQLNNLHLGLQGKCGFYIDNCCSWR